MTKQQTIEICEESRDNYMTAENKRKSLQGILRMAETCRLNIINTHYFRPTMFYTAYRYWLELAKERRLTQ